MKFGVTTVKWRWQVQHASRTIRKPLKLHKICWKDNSYNILWSAEVIFITSVTWTRQSVSSQGQSATSCMWFHQHIQIFGMKACSVWWLNMPVVPVCDSATWSHSQTGLWYKIHERQYMRGADKHLALLRKQQAMGLKTCIYCTYYPLSSIHLWLNCPNFFNPSKKNSFGFAANKKIGEAKDLSATLNILKFPQPPLHNIEHIFPNCNMLLPHLNMLRYVFFCLSCILYIPDSSTAISTVSHGRTPKLGKGVNTIVPLLMVKSVYKCACFHHMHLRDQAIAASTMFQWSYLLQLCLFFKRLIKHHHISDCNIMGILTVDGHSRTHCLLKKRNPDNTDLLHCYILHQDVPSAALRLVRFLSALPPSSPALWLTGPDKIHHA
jgi:hypothetical protein